MARHDKIIAKSFEGFDRPESNWFRMPNNWTDMTAGITSIAELKVVEYILRHTWGYQEYALKKHITIDEFVSGRRRQDGSRMDDGTGLSERAVYDGIRKAVEDGLIEEETDSSDRGRVKKYFSLRMRDAAARELSLQNPQSGVQSLQGMQTLQAPVQSLPNRGAKSAPRSEKDTLERIDLSNIRKTSRNNHDAMADDADAGVRPDEASTAQSATPRLTSGGRLTFMTSIGETIDERRRRATINENEVRSENAPVRAERASQSATAPRRGRLHRPRYEEETYQVIQSYIADFARELNDRAPLKTSTTRAYHLYQRSGLERDAFIAQLYAARAIVKERAGSIRSVGEKDAWGVPVKQRAAYFYAVLEDLLGLREKTEEETEGAVEDTESS